MITRPTRVFRAALKLHQGEAHNPPSLEPHCTAKSLRELGAVLIRRPNSAGRESDCVWYHFGHPITVCAASAGISHPNEKGLVIGNLLEPRRRPGGWRVRGVTFGGERTVEFIEIPDPVPGLGEVVVEMKASGICGSDLHMYRGPRGMSL